MINKDEFIKIIERLRDAKDLINNVNNLFRNSKEYILNDFADANGMNIYFDDIVINLLENIFNDKSETISWWIYEQDYGRSFKIGNFIEENNKKIDLATAEKLYDYLIKT